jgi:hypothetical protein
MMSEQEDSNKNNDVSSSLVAELMGQGTEKGAENEDDKETEGEEEGQPDLNIPADGTLIHRINETPGTTMGHNPNANPPSTPAIGNGGATLATPRNLQQALQTPTMMH